MKNLVYMSVVLLFLISSVISCAKEEVKEVYDNDKEFEVIQSRAQEGGECFKKTIVYREYIDCTKEGTTCKVTCDDFSSGDASLVSYLSSVDTSVNNTLSLQNFLSNLSYIPASIQNDIQSASLLGFTSSQNSVGTVYAVLDSNGDVLYAFSF